MGSEILRKKIEWEARRVAAAFGVEGWDEDEDVDHAFIASMGGTLYWCVFSAKGEIRVLSIDSPEAECGAELRRYESEWEYDSCAQYDEIMARGLYRLGIEDKSVLGQLPLLTAQEKAELRLSMPHEFWPQEWLDENGN
jgi:hypothetical protein